MKKAIKAITIVATIAFLIVCGVLFYQTLKISSLKKTDAQLSARLQDLQAIETSINDGITMRESDSYKQQEIRDSLGMIKDDEQIIIVK